ncbi:MAG: metallophosphoesterase family protein [bacterium]
MKKISCFKTLFALALVFAMFIGHAWAFEGPHGPWRFGIISDTQWTVPDDGKNPNTVAADIIKQIDREFILKGVDLVIAVGDTVDVSTQTSIDTRALFAQDLYNAGIGFYPLRGNHEAEWTGSGPEFARVFPQTQNGVNNNTPGDISLSIGVDTNISPDNKVGFPFVVGYNFSSPNLTFNGVSTQGLTYSFDYNNVRFVLLDQFDNSGNTNNTTISLQQPWITGRLSDPKRPQHAFVFAHKGLITENHVDNLFGLSPAADPASTDAFIESLANNGVRYYIGGHDHMHDRTIVWTTDDKTASVHELVCASDSSKFYTPANPSNDTTYDVPAFGHTRQIPLSQDLYRIGYYLVTVDGPHVTVDYYAVPSGAAPAAPGGSTTILTTPPLSGNWQKRERFGYSLNGKEFLVAQNQFYTNVQDSFANTTAAILSGTNGSTATDASGRPFTKAVDIGWSYRSHDTASDILTLWGMASNPGSDQTDVYTLSMSYDSHFGQMQGNLKSGLFGLATKDANGNWINAVDKNFGGTVKFVLGPWNPTYGLGTYGIDPSTHTAWAIINYNSQFAVTWF